MAEVIAVVALLLAIWVWQQDKLTSKESGGASLRLQHHVMDINGDHALIDARLDEIEHQLELLGFPVLPTPRGERPEVRNVEREEP